MLFDKVTIFANNYIHNVERTKILLSLNVNTILQIRTLVKIVENSINTYVL